MLEEEFSKARSKLTTKKLALQRAERRSDFSAGLSASSRKRYEEGNDGNDKDASKEKSLMELTVKGDGNAAESAPQECAQS